MRRSGVPHMRPAASLARDASIPLGRRWGMDLTCRMPLGVDGKRYGILFVEKHKLQIFICYLVDKTTSSFVYALRELVISVRARFPGAFPLELHGDSDRAWTITGRGDDTLPAELAAYMANEEAVIMRRSASGAHGRCPAESAIGKALNLTFTNQLRGHLGPPTLTDMMRGAANQINDQPAHGGRRAWASAEAGEAAAAASPPHSCRTARTSSGCALTQAHGGRADCRRSQPTVNLVRAEGRHELRIERVRRGRRPGAPFAAAPAPAPAPAAVPAAGRLRRRGGPKDAKAVAEKS